MKLCCISAVSSQCPPALSSACRSRQFSRELRNSQVVSCQSPPHFRRLAYNGEAAWRRRGVHNRSLEPQTVNAPRNVIRSYTPACAKPLVSRSPISLLLFHSLPYFIKRYIFKLSGGIDFFVFKANFDCCFFTDSSDLIV